LPDWPSPPLYEVLLLEMFWPGAVVLGVAALMLGWSALRTGCPKRFIPAGICAVLAGGNVLTATLIETPREALRQRDRDLVGAFVRMDRPALADLLAERVRFEIKGDPVADLNTRDALLAESDDVARRYRITEWGLRRNEAAEVDGRWRTFMMVQATIRMTGDGAFAGSDMLSVSTWELTWRQAADGVWRLGRVNWLSLNGRTPPRDVFR